MARTSSNQSESENSCKEQASKAQSKPKKRKEAQSCPAVQQRRNEKGVRLAQ